MRKVRDLMIILKYILDIKDHQRIEMGCNDALPLSVAEQDGKLMLWAQVKENAFPEDYNCAIEVHIIGTGNPYDEPKDPAEFIGTVVMSYGLVWHVFAKMDYPTLSGGVKT